MTPNATAFDTRSGWTGAQASVLRWLLGAGVMVFAMLGLPWLLALGFAGLLMAVGLHTRWSALLLTGLLAWTLKTEFAWPLWIWVPLEESVAVLPLATLACLWVACWPRAPYGSVDGAGRPDPRGDWSLGVRFDLLWVAWSVVSFLGACVARDLFMPYFGGMLHGDESGLFGWRNYESLPLTLIALNLLVALFGPFRATRKLAWVLCAVMVCSLLCLQAGFGLLSPVIWFLVALFDPAWIPARAGTIQMFYDGECALCQGFARFAIAEDRLGQIEFGTQSGSTYTELVGDSAAAFPDSVVVHNEAGETLVRSAAVLSIAHHLGGLWRVLAVVGGFVPRPLRDWAYDRVASVRKRLGVKSTSACPAVGPDVSQRFLP